jgi:hypothetical protein
MGGGIFKAPVRETGCEDVERVQVAQGGVLRRAFVNTLFYLRDP